MSNKLCPFAAAIPNQEDSVCLLENCACYVEMHKPMYLHDTIVDPEVYYSYVGCGLITQVPWTIKERKPKTEKPLETPA